MARSTAITVNRLMGPVIKPVLFLLASAPLLKALSEIAMELFGWGRSSLGANPVEELLNRGGIWGLNLLLLTLCVTPLRQLTGWHALGRVRRMLGLFAFFYICMHLTVYITLDRALELGTIVEDVIKRPYITVGFSAFVLMMPLAITSFDGLRRRMGQAWQR
ncbi:MAG: protein-methionine-sulfoxide reductase heme-binding subunit MsrQ, partial [Pseudomonadota bacterium]